MTRLRFPALVVLAILTSSASPALAQGGGGFFGPGVTTGEPTQVFSTNPFGLVMDFLNAEYEVKVGETFTAGAGASRRAWVLFGESQDWPRLNGDVFLRYYPGGQAFNGFAIGVKAGATRMPHAGTFPGVGFDLNHSHALTDHVVFSSGLGMKRLIGHDRQHGGPTTITTLRVNIGIGF